MDRPTQWPARVPRQHLAMLSGGGDFSAKPKQADRKSQLRQPRRNTSSRVAHFIRASQTPLRHQIGCGCGRCSRALMSHHHFACHHKTRSGFCNEANLPRSPIRKGHVISRATTQGCRRRKTDVRIKPSRGRANQSRICDCAGVQKPLVVDRRIGTSGGIPKKWIVRQWLSLFKTLI